MEREIRALRQRVITAYQKFIYCIPSRKPVNELLSCNPSLYLCFFVLVAQIVKNLPAMRETGIRSLGWEDHLEKEMATHSSVLAWRILEIKETDSYSPWGCKELDTTV